MNSKASVLQKIPVGFLLKCLHLIMPGGTSDNLYNGKGIVATEPKARIIAG